MTTDLTNQAIAWMQSEKSLTPDRPFFIYFAPGATHAPHQVAKEWIAKRTEEMPALGRYLACWSEWEPWP